MNSSPEKDYSRTGSLAVVALIATLVAVSFIPPCTVGGVKLRRADILSQVWSFADADPEIPSEELFDAEDFDVDMAEVTDRIVTDTIPEEVQTLFEWHMEAAAATAPRPAALPVDSLRATGPVIPIETVDSLGFDRFDTFCDTLMNARRPVRIAVLGDSFIEGDILTADLRERLQERYGGGGTGFAPMASPLTAFRRTVKTQSKGWTTYNIMQRKAAPEPLRSAFYVSGWLCLPDAGASTRWETTAYRRRLDACTTGRIFFLSPHESRIELTVNDTLRREFPVSGSPAVRQIAVTAPRIGSLSFRLCGRSEGFVGYGAVMEGGGVSVDNYSVRSNNGQAMFWTDPSVNAQIDAFLDYDLVILQYGLNIMQRGVSNYARYGEQIEKMVAFVHECFPGAAVLVMGVSDRSVKTDSGFEPMDAIPHMTACQRRAARNAGAAFWPTSDAMRSRGGMARFVQQGWAGKDFTHINYAGGREVAHALADAIDRRARDLHLRREADARRRRSVLDSLQQARIEARLRPAITSVQPLDSRER